jgi:hypothetical protein
MSTTTRVTTDPGEFKATVFPFLQGDPVLHSVVLSNTEDRIKGLLHDPAPPVFVSVHGAGGSVVGAVMRTALRGIYLGGLADALEPAVVDAYAAATGDGDAYAPVVEGTATAARLFAEEWSGRFDKEYSKTRGSRLHKLGRFVEQKAGGAPRRATPAHLVLATRWVGEFGAEIGHPLGPAEDEQWTRTRIERGRLWIWEDGGRPVSMVGHQDTVFGSTRIGPVYTPPAERGHGYASALTADVSKRILAKGSAACLFTDLANPTSNRIYAAIGYEPVADFVRYDLS